MAYKNITASGAVNVSGACNTLRIQVNAALTGTITVLDGSTTVGTITNPTVGAQFEYWNLKSTVSVNPSATCDITVMVGGSHNDH